MKNNHRIPPTIRGFSSSLVLVLFLTGSSHTGNQEHTFRVFEENGVTIAETSGGPKYSGEIFLHEPVATLHEDENRPESLMGRPFVYNLMGEDGSVFVTDSQFNRVLRFDASGEYLHDIGGQGQGPGEYENPRPLSAHDGVITIYDQRMNRTSFYRYDGTFLESMTSFRRRSFSIDALHRGPDDEIIFIESRRTREAENGYFFQTASALVCSASEDTLAVLTTDPVKGDYMLGLRYCWRLFGGWPQIVYQQNLGIIMTTGEESEIRYYDLTGELRRIVRLDIPPEPVTRQERRIWAEAERRMVESAQTPELREDMRERTRYIEFNDPKAFWTDMKVDENGYIWAERPGGTFQSFTSTDRTNEYLVFSPKGEYLGITNLPGASAISRGHLITRQDNVETGGIEMVIYRIVPAVPGLIYP